MSARFARPAILAAGGTGGHLFPALATAEALMRRGRRVALFTDARGAQYGAKIDGLDTVTVPSASPSRGGLAGKFRFLIDNARGGMFARRLLTGYRAGIAVGFGGYAAFPTCYMAVRTGVPLVLHEQNAHLGRANRRLAHAARAIALGFPGASGMPQTAARIVPVGNPVRPAFLPLRERAYAPPGAAGPIRLFVMGGSQGARSFSETIPAAIAALPEGLRARLDIAQQCRAEDLQLAEASYAKLGLPVTLKTFFDDVPDRLGTAHLLIVRAGASTVAEISFAGRPAIYVPYPFAADDHQRANADAVVGAGAGWMFAQSEFTTEALAARLAGLLAAPDALARAAAAARAFGRPNAAEDLADLVERHILPEETASP